MSILTGNLWSQWVMLTTRPKTRPYLQTGEKHPSNLPRFGFCARQRRPVPHSPMNGRHNRLSTRRAAILKGLNIQKAAGPESLILVKLKTMEGVVAQLINEFNLSLIAGEVAESRKTALHRGVACRIISGKSRLENPGAHVGSQKWSVNGSDRIGFAPEQPLFSTRARSDHHCLQFYVNQDFHNLWVCRLGRDCRLEAHCKALDKMQNVRGLLAPEEKW